MNHLFRLFRKLGGQTVPETAAPPSSLLYGQIATDGRNFYLGAADNTIRIIKSQFSDSHFHITDAGVVIAPVLSSSQATISSYIQFPDGSLVNTAGLISGELKFNTIAKPPIVSSGIRNFKKINIQEIADVTLETTNALGAVSQSFGSHIYTWQRVIVDVSGNYYYIPSFDTASAIAVDVPLVDSGGGVYISVSGGVATVYTGDTSGLSDKQIAVIKGSNIGVLVGKISNIVLNTSFKIPTSAANGSYTGVSYSAYYRIVTNHGAGALVNTDADVAKYSPSPDFCAELNGYYLDQYGIPTTSAGSAVYRIIGNFYINASSQTSAGYIISYKSGSNKDDNIVESDSTATSGTASTVYGVAIARFTKLWGNDYTYTNADGRYTANRKLRASFGVMSWLTVAGSAAAYNYLRIDGNFKSEHYQSVVTNNSVNRIKLYLNSDLPKSSYLDIYAGIVSTSNQVYNIDAKFEVL